MNRRKAQNDNGNLTIGLIILVIGAVLLFRKMGIFIPGWIISWPMIFIAIGLITLVKHNFKSGFGVFMVLFGSFWLLKRELNLPFEMEQYLIPVGLIVLGLFIILSRKKETFSTLKDWNGLEQSFGKNTLGTKEISDTSDPNLTASTDLSIEGGDVVNSQALFCGIQKRVLSKNFKGGKLSAIFGGTDIDLSQADLTGPAVLDVEVAFGGIKLIVPPHWDIQINVTNMFAGVEDKRMYPQTKTDVTKILRIKGTIFFGGLEIKSF